MQFSMGWKKKTVIPSQCAHWRGNPLGISGTEGDCHTSDVGHWFAMTVKIL